VLYGIFSGGARKVFNLFIRVGAVQIVWYTVVNSVFCHFYPYSYGFVGMLTVWSQRNRWKVSPKAWAAFNRNNLSSVHAHPPFEIFFPYLFNTLTEFHVRICLHNYYDQ
jgi:hypothetical protein